MTQTKTHIDNLLALCMEGNQRAQMEVYNRYYKAMYNTALRIVIQTDQAEDIMQDAFLTAFTKLHTFKGTASFGAWLKRIVINRSINALKKCQPIEVFDDIHAFEQIEMPETHLENEYEQLKATQVLKAIKKLKSNYRTVLTLFYVEGFDYEEISQIMNLSYGHSRTMLSRAKIRLKHELASTEFQHH